MKLFDTFGKHIHAPEILSLFVTDTSRICLRCKNIAAPDFLWVGQIFRFPPNNFS